MINNYLRILVSFIFCFGSISCQFHSKTIVPVNACQVVSSPVPFEFSAAPDIKFLQPIINGERIVLLLRDANGEIQAVIARNLRTQLQTKRQESAQVFLLVYRKRSLRLEEANGQVIAIKGGRNIKFVEQKYMTTVPKDEKDYYNFHKGNRITAELFTDLELMESAWGFSKPIIENICEGISESLEGPLKNKRSGTLNPLQKSLTGEILTGTVLCFIDNEWCKSSWEWYFGDGVDWGDWTEDPDPDIDTDPFYPDDGGDFDDASSIFVCNLKIPEHCRGVRGTAGGQASQSQALKEAKKSCKRQCGIEENDPLTVQDTQCGSWSSGETTYWDCCVTACCPEPNYSSPSPSYLRELDIDVSTK